MTPEQLEKAILDPSAVFETPESVLDEASLTKQQKIDILLRWEYNAAEEAVALEEGMPGNDSDVLRQVLTRQARRSDRRRAHRADKAAWAVSVLPVGQELRP
jgi:hypothetical protein